MKKRANCIRVILAAVAFECLACTKQADTSPPPQSGRATAVSDQTYRSRDGRIITIISADELELAEDGVNYVCKYSKQDGTMRVILNALGTTQAVYYRVTPDGFQDPKGRMFYSKAGLPNAARADMCSIATAFYSHGIDFKTYYLVDSMHSTEQSPVALDAKTDGPRSVDLVRRALSPLYLHDFPSVDPYGSPYQFAIKERGNECTITSLGLDRRPGGGDDLVLEVNGKGHFLSLPKGSALKDCS